MAYHKSMREKEPNALNQPAPKLSDDAPIALNFLDDSITRFTINSQDMSRSERERQAAQKELAEASFMRQFVGRAQERMQKGTIKDWRDDLETIFEKSGIAEEKARQAGDTVKADKIWRQYEIISKYYSRLTPEELKKHAEIYMRKERPKPSEQTANESPEKRYEALFNEIRERGRVAIHTSISSEFARSRNLPHSGFNDVADSRIPRPVGIRIVSNQLGDFGVPNIITTLNNSDINAAVTVGPLTEQQPIYKTPPAPKGLAKLFSGTPQPQRVGYENVPTPMSRYTGDKTQKEQAYCLTYVVTGTEAKPYTDPDTRRRGNVFIACVFMPKALAQRTFAEAAKNPHLLRDLFKHLDSELVDSETPHMPTEDKILIVPEGKAKDAFAREGYEYRPQPEFIKVLR